MRIFQQRDAPGQVRLRFRQFMQLKTFAALQNSRCRTVRHFQYPQYFSHDTDRIQIIEPRIFDLRLLLTQHPDHHLFMRGFPNQAHGLGPPDDNRHGHARKQHHVPQRENRQTFTNFIDPFGKIFILVAFHQDRHHDSHRIVYLAESFPQIQCLFILLIHSGCN